MSTCGKLVYSNYGNPLVELSLVEEPAPTTIQPGEALVRVLYSPINPSDLMTIEGHYPVRPPLPAIPGVDGVVEVIKGSTLFQPGDRAVVFQPGWGMWKQFGVVDEKQMVKLPKELPLEAAAMIIVNPSTAYLMLKYIVPLNPGDALIQNAANSALGQIVIQLAKAAGIKTINVIRNRPNAQETIDMLKELGADAVITDADLKKGFANLNLGLPAPKLALECVGGQAAADLVSALAKGGTMAVYGELSGQNVNVPQGDLIFRGIHVKGFWVAEWLGQNGDKFGKIMEELMALYIDGKLKLPKFRKFPMAQWKEAVEFAIKGFSNEKVLLQFN